ncbi:MAG: Mrp/NBP35 family ATP-binding protein [Halobacteriales archaeon]|nr:Mrp/NBP35 family ATP-binding protein [Halobacteriales archaeon]
MSDSEPPTPDAVRRALAAAAVGTSELGIGASLDQINGFGAVTRTGDGLTIEVTLPIPDEDIRAAITTAIREALAGSTTDDVRVEWTPTAADPGHRVAHLPDVKNVIAVASGKGGVGKSTVAANLAVALADAGAAVGLLDADVYGPNAPTLLGIDRATPRTTSGDRIVPRQAHGVSVMSMDFVTAEDDPIIWRGPLVDDLLEQLTADVEWGVLDYLLVDLPPGTGDAQLSLVQHLPVAGAVVVTTPQDVAVDDARRGLRQFARYDVPVLGVVENMSGFRCPDCGTHHEIFGDGGADGLAAEFEVPVLGRIPLDPDIGDLRADTEPTGLSIPLIGDLQLPRSAAGRSGRRPPTAIRAGGGDARTAFRRLAARTAARINQAAEIP